MAKSPWLLFFPIIFTSSASVAASNIDVLLVFSDDSGLSSFEKSAVAGRYQQVLSAVYDDQLNLTGLMRLVEGDRLLHMHGR